VNEVEGTLPQAAIGCVAAGEDNALALRQMFILGEAAAGVAAGGGTETAAAAGAGANDTMEDKGSGGRTVKPDGAAGASGCEFEIATAEAD
jgi:hypothetical protein